MNTKKVELNNKIKKVLIGIEMTLAALIIVIVMGSYLEGSDIAYKCGHIENEKGITIFLVTILSKLSEYLQTINIDLIILIIFLVNTIFSIIFCVKAYNPTKKNKYTKKLIILEIILSIFITIILGDFIFVHRYGAWSACYYYRDLDLLFVFGLLPIFILLFLFLIIKNKKIKKIFKTIIIIILILYTAIIVYISFLHYYSYIDRHNDKIYTLHQKPNKIDLKNWRWY